MFWVLASANDILRVDFAVRSGQAVPEVSAAARRPRIEEALDSRIVSDHPPQEILPAPTFPEWQARAEPPADPSNMDSRFVAAPPFEERIRRRSERSRELAQLPEAVRESRTNEANRPEIEGRKLDPLWLPVPAPETPPGVIQRTKVLLPPTPIAVADIVDPVLSERDSLSANAPQGAKVDRLPKPLPNNREPRYPDELRRRQIEGRVMLRVVIGLDGSVDDVQIELTSGQPLLDESALAAIRTWKFEPARQGQRAVRFEVRIPVNFRIRP